MFPFVRKGLGGCHGTGHSIESHRVDTRLSLCCRGGVIIIGAGGERHAYHHCCREGKSLACHARQKIVLFHFSYVFP